MARNDAAAMGPASSHHGGSGSKQQHGKKGQQHQQQHQHHNAQHPHSQHQQHHNGQQSKKGGAGAKPPAFVMPTRILAKPETAASPAAAELGGAAAGCTSIAAAASIPAPAAVPAPTVVKTAAGLPALLYHRPVELLDARGKLVGSDALMSLLSDSAATPSSSSSSASAPSVPAPFPCDFTVFGAVGTQFSGRSTILNALARPHSSAPRTAASGASASGAPREPTFLGGDSTRPDGFDVASHDQMLQNSSAAGIQVLVTPERNILVDTPPLDAASTLASMIGNKEGGAALPASSTTVEIAFQLHSLQTMLLLLGSCHVLLVCCESHTLLPMCRLLQRALLLRQHLSPDTHFLSSRAAAPPSATSALRSSSDLSFHGLPDIVFVLNKQPLRELCHPMAGSALSESAVISTLFREQPFRKQGAVSTFRPPSPPLSRASSAANASAAEAPAETVNCFQLPFCPDTAAGTASSTSELSLALQELTFQLLTLLKLPASSRASERDWLRHVTRLWQGLQSAPVLAEWRAALQKAAPRTLPIAVAIRNPAARTQRERGPHAQQNNSKHAGAQQKAAAAAAAAAKDSTPHSASASSPALPSSASSSQHAHHPRGSKKQQHPHHSPQPSRSEASQHDRSVHGVQSSRRLYEPPPS